MKTRELEEKLAGRNLKRCGIIERREGGDLGGLIERAVFAPGSFTIRWWHDGFPRTTTFDDYSWSYEFPDDRTLHIIRTAPDTRDFDAPWPTANLYVVTLPTS